MAGKGTMLAKVGWPAKKFYLSPEAIELLRQHCEGTPLTMSAYLDLLIKQNLGRAPVGWTPEEMQREQQRVDAAKKRALERGIAQVRETLASTDMTDAEAAAHIANLRREHKKQSTKKDVNFDL